MLSILLVIDMALLQMVAFHENPYSDCGGENNVTTSVVALEIKQSDGNEVALRGLQREIDLRISRPELPFDLDNESFIMTVNGTSSQFHIFNHSLDNVAVTIEFFSGDHNVRKWTLMVAYGRRPSVEENLGSWSVNGKERKLFLLDSSLLKDKGMYHILVEGIAGLSPSNSYIFNASYSLKISTLRCFFWHEATERWSSEGCKVS